MKGGDILDFQKRANLKKGRGWIQKRRRYKPPYQLCFVEILIVAFSIFLKLLPNNCYILFLSANVLKTMFIEVLTVQFGPRHYIWFYSWFKSSSYLLLHCVQENLQENHSQIVFSQYQQNACSNRSINSRHHLLFSFLRTSIIAQGLSTSVNSLGNYQTQDHEITLSFGKNWQHVNILEREQYHQHRQQYYKQHCREDQQWII